jgi:hypothetical protein
MMDQIYILIGKDLEETYQKLQRDLSSVAMEINNGGYIFPYPSDLQAIIQIVHNKENNMIGLKFMPAIEDKELLKPLTDIINQYNFKPVAKRQAEEMVFIIPTKNK